MQAPKLIPTTPMVSAENILHGVDDDVRRSMLGSHSVAPAELQKLDKLESFQRSGLVAMKDHEAASRSKLSLAGSATKGFFKLLLSFKIFQTAADGALFLHGRLTKEPFHAKMDEKLEGVMHDLSKGYTADISKFDPESYIACMDSFVLGENISLPRDPLADLNKLLVEMLISSNDDDWTVESKVREFLQKNQSVLNNARLGLDEAVVSEITKGNGILTPKILLAKLVTEMRKNSGNPDGGLIKGFVGDCRKTVEFYDQCTAMSLYGKSVVNMKILEAAARKEMTNLERCRNILDVSTDFLMSFVPFIYMFVVANMIIDRNVSGATKTENFNEYMDENFSHLNETVLGQIKDFAGNYFTTGKVDEFGLKWGNLMPTTMAISLYFLSTFRLGITIVSPKNESTYVNHAIERLTDTYKAIISSSGKEQPPQLSPGGAGGMEPPADQHVLPKLYQGEPVPAQVETSAVADSPKQPVGEEQIADGSAVDAGSAVEMIPGETVPPESAQQQATDLPAGQESTVQGGSVYEPAMDASAGQEPAAQVAGGDESAEQEPVLPEKVWQQGVPSLQPDATSSQQSVATAGASDLQGAKATGEVGQFEMTIDGGKTVSMAQLAQNPEKYDLNCADVVRAYFNAMEGSEESKIQKIYRVFSGALIGVRALNNVAFEGKDATPDVPVRDWIYDNICTRIIIPLSAIENRGVVDNMMNEQEKSRVLKVFGKVFNNQPLTAEDEDFMQGVINSVIDEKALTKSSYGSKKGINSILTALFMVLHLGILFADFVTAVSDSDGKSALDPLFQKSMGLMNVGLVYKLFYRPVLEVVNMGTFVMQHGLKNMSRYFMLAAWNVIGRSITSAPALPLWNLNTTNFDTLATLVDSAGTTGHDQSTHTNLRKATLESNIDQSRALLHTFVSNPQLWEQAFDQSSDSDTLNKMGDFASVLSQRLDLVAKDLELFSQSLQVETVEPDMQPAKAQETKTWV